MCACVSTPRCVLPDTPKCLTKRGKQNTFLLSFFLSTLSDVVWTAAKSMYRHWQTCILISELCSNQWVLIKSNQPSKYGIAVAVDASTVLFFSMNNGADWTREKHCLRNKYLNGASLCICMHQQVIDFYGGPSGPITAVNERGFGGPGFELKPSITVFFKDLKQRV